jgi:hypothetical protein
LELLVLLVDHFDLVLDGFRSRGLVVGLLLEEVVLQDGELRRDGLLARRRFRGLLSSWRLRGQVSPSSCSALRGSAQEDVQHRYALLAFEPKCWWFRLSLWLGVKYALCQDDLYRIRA